MHLFCWMFVFLCGQEFVSAQARHTKKPKQCIENPFPCRKNLSIPTTSQQLRVVIWLRKCACQWKGPEVNATCLLVAQPTQVVSPSKQATRCIYKQKLVMFKLHHQKQRRWPSWFKANKCLLSHQNKLDPHKNHVIMFPKWISKIGNQILV